MNKNFHPTIQSLGDYYLGLLPPVEVRLVALHLEKCAACTQEMARLASFLKEDEHPSALNTSASPTKFMVIIAQLLDCIVPQQPLLAGVRSAGNSLQTYTWLYQANQSEISLRARPMAGNTCAFQLFGEVSGPLAIQRVSVWSSDSSNTPVVQTNLDEAGQFMLPCLAVGVYDLVFDGEDGLLRIPGLQLEQAE